MTSDPSIPKLRSAELTLRGECVRCGTHLPVNGLHKQVSCGDCGHEHEVSPSLWKPAFSAFDHGRSDSGTIIVKDQTWRWSVKPSTPVCRACDAAIPLSPASPHQCSCGACTPVLNHGGKGQITRVIGVDAEGRAAELPPVEPVAMHCPNCAAGLRITTERQRVADCEHCGSQIHLPDAIWRTLHPPHAVERWWAIFSGPTTAERRREASEAKQAKERAHQKKKAAVRAEKTARKEQERELEREQKRLETQAWSRRTNIALVAAALAAPLVWSIMAALLLMLMMPSTDTSGDNAGKGILVALAAGGAVIAVLALWAASAATAARAQSGQPEALTNVLLLVMLGLVPAAGPLCAAGMGIALFLRLPKTPGTPRALLYAGVALVVTEAVVLSAYVQLTLAMFSGLEAYQQWEAMLGTAG